MALDTDVGIGVGTPIVGSTTDSTFEPLPYTALSPYRYAKIMGINPIQFMSGTDNGILFPTTGCTDRWWHYSWQDPNKVSRMELAEEILRAEDDIAAQLKYRPGPWWIEDDEIVYPRYYRRELTALRGYKPNSSYKTVSLEYGHFIQGGKRTVSLVSAGAAVTLYDDDSDGFNETALITVATALTDACEIKVYYPDTNGGIDYEIRPARVKTLSGGTLTFKFDAWLLFKPEILAGWPGNYTVQPDYIDATDASNYLATVDIYREYADPEEECVLYWEGAPGSTLCGTCGGTGCDSCTPLSQSACIQPKAAKNGSVIVVPSTYSEGVHTPSTFCTGREPDRVIASYQSGASELYKGCKRVPDDLAKAITYMATARLARPLCTTCENVKAMEDRLRQDLIFITDGQTSETRFVTPEVIRCPFGTRRGEVEAWRIIRNRIRRGQVRATAALIG